MLNPRFYRMILSNSFFFNRLLILSWFLFGNFNGSYQLFWAQKLSNVLLSHFLSHLYLSLILNLFLSFTLLLFSNQETHIIRLCFKLLHEFLLLLNLIDFLLLCNNWLSFNILNQLLLLLLFLLLSGTRLSIKSLVDCLIRFIGSTFLLIINLDFIGKVIIDLLVFLDDNSLFLIILLFWSCFL